MEKKQKKWSTRFWRFFSPFGFLTLGWGVAQTSLCITGDFSIGNALLSLGINYTIFFAAIILIAYIQLRKERRKNEKDE